jgi:hypothetical protein
MSRTTRRYVPRLEAFDERCLPSVTAIIVPGSNILQITGDANANTITITDNGTADGVTVVGDGQTFTFTGQQIDAITVDAGAGDDVVTYNLTATLVSSRNTDFNLGTGNDTFTANMNNQGLAQNISLDISAYGQGGKDALTLNAQNFNTDANSILNIDYVGGAGKNSVNFNYSPGLLDLGSVILQNNKK